MKHWVFDLDGTLVDSFSHYFESLKRIFSAHGVRFGEELRHEALTEPLVELFSRHLGPDAVAPAMQRLQVESNEDALRIRPFTGVIEALDRFSEQGSRIAVWTNRDLESASLILKASGLDRRIELCVSGTCVRRRKPHPEGLERIIARFGCDPSEVTMVGDHEHDVGAAKTAGARAVRASWHGHFEMERCRLADFQFHRVEEFARWAGAR